MSWVKTLEAEEAEEALIHPTLGHLDLDCLSAAGHSGDSIDSGEIRCADGEGAEQMFSRLLEDRRDGSPVDSRSRCAVGCCESRRTFACCVVVLKVNGRVAASAVLTGLKLSSAVVLCAHC